MKIVCEVCGNEGYLQHIGKSYYRIRHYIGLDSATKKPKFKYHKQSLLYVENLLNNRDNSSNIDLIGQSNIDLNLNNNGSFTENGWAGSSARIEHRPPKSAVVGSNPTPPVYAEPWTLL